jgi:hypothetical protein
MQLAANADGAADVRRRAGQPVPTSAPMPQAARGDAGARLDAVATTGAASSAPVNEQRFEAAKEAAARRETKTLAALDSETRDERAAGVRRVGTRVFTQRGTVWTDARYVEGMRTVRVKAYSPLYFELVSKLAGLGEALTVGDEVVVAGRKVAVAVASDGAERMGERELQSLVTSW